MVIINSNYLLDAIFVLITDYKKVVSLTLNDSINLQLV